jgi:hypothetical protein
VHASISKYLWNPRVLFYAILKMLYYTIIYTNLLRYRLISYIELTLFSQSSKKWSDFSTISKVNNGQLLWQEAYKYFHCLLSIGITIRVRSKKSAATVSLVLVPIVFRFAACVSSNNFADAVSYSHPLKNNSEITKLTSLDKSLIKITSQLKLHNAK